MNDKKTKRQLEKIIFLMLFFAGAFFHQTVEYGNTSSRYILIESVVDYGSLNIDNFHEGVIDKSFRNGHYYSNKAIGVPLLGVPVYWLLQYINPSSKEQPLTNSERYIIRIVTTTLPFSFLGVVLFRMACAWRATQRSALWVTFAYAFGSIALIHATILSGHQVAASFAFFSFAIIFGLSRLQEMDNENYLFQQLSKSFIAGFFAGLSALADYTAMFIALALTIYVLSLRLQSRQILFFLLGGGLCAAILALYNYYCFGSIWSTSYSHLAFERFREGSSKGFLGVSLPDFRALLSILISPSRGLFFIMPVFLFSIIGCISLWKKKEFKRETCFILTVIVGYFLINAGFYGWHGGWTYGPRYLVPMLPFLAFLMVFARVESFWFYLLFGLSVFQVSLSVIGLPHVPQEIRNPIIEIILPFLGYGYMAVNAGEWFGLQGLWSTIPFFILMVGMGVLIFRRAAATQHSEINTISKAWKISIGFWAALILLMLAVVRTEPQQLVHFYRAQILYHAVKASHSERLYEKANHEATLGGLKPFPLITK
tara:strand:+ start:1419 stop:3041 length:1623 start_codon:yes stop_codon:yes gene_type:complete